MNNQKEKKVPILIILVLLISSISFGINMRDLISISTWTQWGQVAFSTPEEEEQWEQDRQKRKKAYEHAQIRQEKYGKTEKDISILCSIVGIILTIYSLINKKYVKLHVFCTIIMIIGTIILLF